ncbi:MAG: hypothetical protein JSV04_06515 [Candidatus Heimdallarchaeota archaeon]|nr:MAG: hypothetical protein JSV04_06515 [Candidatus Heimdallarchaeota archaeon]
MSRFSTPRFVDVTPETERLKELDHFWIQMDHCRHLDLWRFSYLSDDETGEFIPNGKARFYEPILMIHGDNSIHTIFNWFARELWYFGFRKLFAIDRQIAGDLQIVGNRLDQIIDEIKQITHAERISIIAHSSGGLVARYFAKFVSGADSHIRILALCGVPHDRAQYLEHLKASESSLDESQIYRALDYLEDMNATITEKELYRLTQINLGGGLWSKTPQEGSIRYIPLSDAINISVGQTHMRIHKHKATFGTLRHLLIPNVAAFKIRLLSITNVTKPIGIRIHYKGRITQNYPQRGWLQIPSTLNGPFLPEAPIIIFCNSITLDHCKAELVIYIFEKHTLRRKSVGRVDFTLKCDELPRVDYITINGDRGEQVNLAVYTYIP